jgi:hypothetical protein
MQLVLRPHSSVARPQWEVSGSVNRAGRLVIWSMEVRGPLELAWNTDERFGSDIRKNWELWNFDVVEAFLQLRPTPEAVGAPYLEVQISPLKQGLALVILEPRKAYYTPLSLVWHAQNSVAAGLWKTSVELQLPSDFPEGELWGGLFACLGKGEREFYALNPNLEARPDFHRPELFRPL